MGSSDEQLVGFVLGGSDEAFEVLFERHVADSLWYAREVLGSWGDAEDAVRHSFAAAHAYLETRGGETEFAPWLQTILGNHCLSMLQARTPGPARKADDDANVVDLGEWRLRRKLFGVALPIAPSAALRDSVMAACGIGAGAGAAATAGVPLLGGALANLAVVAVLAGGVGVAGHVAPDRVAAVDAGTETLVERVADAPSQSRGGRGDGGSPRQLAGHFRRSAGEVVRVKTPRHDIRKLPAPRDRVQAEQSPSKALPATPVPGPSGLALPAPDPATVEAPVAVPLPLGSKLRRVVDDVKARLPATGDVTEIRLPDAVDLPRIGDDLGVTPAESPVDVRPLLAQGADAPPN